MKITNETTRDGGVPKITIRTRLHESIYKSHGGQTRTYYSWSIGPRNLMKAMAALGEHSRDMTNGYGNVGHCGSWIEVAGVRMTEDDIDAFSRETDTDNFDQFTRAKTKTGWCSDYINSVLDGSLSAKRRELAKHLDAELLAMREVQNVNA